VYALTCENMLPQALAGRVSGAAPPVCGARRAAELSGALAPPGRLVAMASPEQEVRGACLGVIAGALAGAGGCGAARYLVTTMVA
jgi:hypothetical protein